MERLSHQKINCWPKRKFFQTLGTLYACHIVLMWIVYHLFSIFHNHSWKRFCIWCHWSGYFLVLCC